jgi:hypothetical protein
MAEQMAALTARMGAIEQRHAAIDTALMGHAERMGAAEQQMTGLDGAMADCQVGLVDCQSRMSAMETAMAALMAADKEWRPPLLRRVDDLETRAQIPGPPGPPAPVPEDLSAEEIARLFQLELDAVLGASA